MATGNLLTTQFDDSEDEDDNFNPAPADLSDDENAGDYDESEATLRNEGTRRRVGEDTYDDGDDEGAPPGKTNGKSRTQDQRDHAANEDGGDDEGGGEDLNGEAADEEDEDEEEEEDDDEEEVTVCATPELQFQA
jgi:transcription elongation factor SPT5